MNLSCYYCKVDINEASGDAGVTSLMISCLLGRDDTVKLLLKHGADPGLTDRDQLNSFHYSVWGMVRGREGEGVNVHVYRYIHVQLYIHLRVHVA